MLSQPSTRHLLFTHVRRTREKEGGRLEITCQTSFFFDSAGSSYFARDETYFDRSPHRGPCKTWTDVHSEAQVEFKNLPEAARKYALKFGYVEDP